MPLESLDCPNCGAPLPDAGGRSVVVCSHCGSSIRIQSAVPPAAPAPRPAEPREYNPGTTVGEYGRPPGDRPERSALASVTLGPSDVAEVVQLLRDKQELAAIQFYHDKVGGTLGEAKEAIEAIEAGLKDASAPLPLSAEQREKLRAADRNRANQPYRRPTGAGLAGGLNALDDAEQRVRRAPARSGSGLRSAVAVVGSIVILIMCILGGCGVYLQTKPIYRCSIDLVKAEVVKQKLLKAPVQAGYLVISPGFEESSGFDSWNLSAEYFTPVWGANGWGLAYVAVASNSSGSNAMSAKLYSTDGTFRLRNWAPVDCPSTE